jgi:hypothetical protein
MWICSIYFYIAGLSSFLLLFGHVERIGRHTRYLLNDKLYLNFLRGLPTSLLGRISDEDLILLSASPDAGARTVEGSGVQGGGG